jgi:lipooligosaccharide transport system ATP-binding protein
MSAPSPELTVHATGLRKRLGTTDALDSLDVSMPRGRVLAVLGPNGAGKTTFVKTIATLLRPDSGSLTVAGQDVVRSPHLVRRSIGLAGQYAAVEPAMTGRENLRMVARLFGHDRDRASRAADVVLDQLGLLGDGDRLVREYSGGMRRRLDLGASLVGAPRLLLLDEPTTGLDPQARHILWDRLYRLKQRGVTLVLTTHYMDEAEQLCDRLVVMDGGRIVAEGSPRGLIEQHATREVLELRLHRDTVGEAAAQADRDAAALATIEGIGDRQEVLPDRVLIYAHDGEAALADVHGRGVEPVGSLVRRSSLEDVFLRLTGRTLID